MGLLSWWYTDGFMSELGRIFESLRRTAGFFSIGQLAATLFAPYRQIASSPTGAETWVQRLIDVLISRVMGAIVRIGTITIGLVAMCSLALAGVVRGLLWPLVPLVPVAGAILAILGVSI